MSFPVISSSFSDCIWKARTFLPLTKTLIRSDAVEDGAVVVEDETVSALPNDAVIVKGSDIDILETFDGFSDTLIIS